MKVSFDFDSTLSRRDVQEYATSLVNSNYEVWIVTSRCATEPALEKGWHWVTKQNQELYDVAEACGILKERIVFTDHVDKIVYLKGKGFAFHLDDDPDELIYIFESGDPCIPINVDYFAWKEECDKILK
jgi:hypothetical protein